MKILAIVFLVFFVVFFLFGKITIANKSAGFFGRIVGSMVGAAVFSVVLGLPLLGILKLLGI